MASTAKDDLISEIQRRYLECNVCTEVFNESDHVPRLLPCQHTFCSACLKKLCKRKYMKCPSCNAEHNLDQHGIIQLPKDNVRRDLVSFLQTQENTIEFLLCSKCGNTIVIEVCFICSLCKMLFCDDCRNSHKTDKPSHDSFVKSYKADNGISSEVCNKPDHKNAPMKYYCTSCEISVCPICAFTEHRDISLHPIEDITHVFDARKTSFDSSLSSLRQKITIAKNALERFGCFGDALKQHHLTFSEDICKLYNRGVQILDQHKQRLLMKETIAYTQKQRTISERKKKVAKFIANAEECYDLSKQIVQYKNMRSFLQVHTTLEHHLQMFVNESMIDIDIFETTNHQEDHERMIKGFENLVEMIDDTTIQDNTTDIFQQSLPSHRMIAENDNNNVNAFIKICWKKIKHTVRQLVVDRHNEVNLFRDERWWQIFAISMISVFVLLVIVMFSYIDILFK